MIIFEWKEVVSRWVQHVLNNFQKAERVRVARETIETLNNCEHRILSKTLMADEPYVPFYDMHPRRYTNTNNAQKQKRCQERYVHSFFQSPALGKATKEKNQHTVIANWYTTKCLPPVAESVDVHGLATYDFWLFFNLEKHLREQSFTPENAIDEAPHQFFESISKDDLL